jgi:hypothetical protein
VNREQAFRIVLALVGFLFVAMVYPMVMFVRHEPALSMMLSLYVTLGMDSYAYQGVKPAANPSERMDGTLGTDSMLARQAVIDFGTEFLFIKN